MKDNDLVRNDTIRMNFLIEFLTVVCICTSARCRLIAVNSRILLNEMEQKLIELVIAIAAFVCVTPMDSFVKYVNFPFI